MKKHFNCTDVSYDKVRDAVEYYLKEQSAGSLTDGLSLLSLAELFDLVVIFNKDIDVDKQLVKEIREVDPDDLRYEWIQKRMKIKGNPLGEKLVDPLITQMIKICPSAKVMVTKFSIILLIDSKPVVRFEKITHRRYRYVYGTIVIDNVRSRAELYEILPKFLLDSDLKIGMRYAKRQACIRNVTGSTLLRFVRHLKFELKKI